MNIPIFYWIWVADDKLMQSMKESKFSETEALGLYRKYVENKKKYLKRMMIFVLLFLISAGVAIIGGDYIPNEGYVYIPLLVLLFVGVFGAISSFNKYSVSGQYVKALQNGYPQIR